MKSTLLEKIDLTTNLLFRKNTPEVEAISKKAKLKGFNDLLNYAWMPREDLMMQKDGALMAFFYYQGDDVQSSIDEELDYVTGIFNHALRLTGDGWMIENNLIRVPSTSYPEDNNFPDAVSALIDDERRNQYQSEKVHYDTFTYLTVSKVPDVEINRRIKKFALDTDEEIKDETLIEYIEKFEKALDNVMDILSGAFNIERLNGGNLLKFLHYCISGKREEIAVPEIPVFMDSYLSNEDFVGGILPKIGKKFIKVLSFNEYSLKTGPTVLEELNSLSLEYRWSSRFISLDQESAKSYMNAHLKYWRQKAIGFLGLVKESFGIPNTKIDADAVGMVDQSNDGISSNSSGLVRYGFITQTVILMSEDKEELEENAALIRKRLQQNGFLIRYESVNAVEAYLGSIPGHGYYNIRRPLMDSLNFVNLVPTSSIYQGEENCPCPFYGENLPALFYGKTEGNTPYRFNLHNNDVGHTMIIGPTGSGKTTLMGLIIAQHRKYKDSQIFVFDKDNSNKIVIQALSGDYYDMGSEEKKIENIHFAPLQHLDDVEELDWCCSFIEELCDLQGEKLNAEEKKSVRDTLETMKNTDRQYWTIHDFILSCQEQKIKTTLHQYESKSAIGKILNQAKDSIELSGLMGFELGWLLQQNEAVYIPVIKYLFRKFYKIFKKQKPTLFILEEAWLYVDNAYISKMLKDWLKTLRKMNVSVIFTSQALNDVADSPIRPVLAESCLTKIFLGNKEAKTSNLGTYEKFGMNQQQINLISDMTYKREYYVTNHSGKRVIDLGLGELTLAFIGVGLKADQDAFKKIYDKDNPQWIHEWLKYKKLDDWADYYKEKYLNKKTA